MGDVGDFLFGDSEDAKQTGTAELLTPAQKQLLEQLTGQIGDQLGEGVAPYGGDTAAGASPLQSAAYSKIQQMLGQNPQQRNAQSQSEHGEIDVLEHARRRFNLHVHHASDGLDDRRMAIHPRHLVSVFRHHALHREMKVLTERTFRIRIEHERYRRAALPHDVVVVLYFRKIREWISHILREF